MREILFRGKSLSTGRWVTGFYFKDEENTAYIAYMKKTGTNWIFVKEEVIVETIGQYTELRDINGKKIFEGDVVKFQHNKSVKDTYYRNYVVEFVNTYVTYGLRLRNKSIHFPFKKSTALNYETEVIGNVYDNADLLKE